MGETDFLRSIPSVDRLLTLSEIEPFLESVDPRYVTAVVRAVVEGFRERAKAGEKADPATLMPAIVDELRRLTTPSFRSAVNALGIILHTGLGRAPYHDGVAEALGDVASGYSRLQIDDEGRRADRYAKIEWMLRLITGADGGLFVNNNAGATLLILSALARGKEVIISRGQLIEIGGSFRIPEVMAQSGAIMREVGTTNRTHLKDYEQAIGENTGAIIRVHQSNYRMSGFVKQVGLNDLTALGAKARIPVVDDLGSGALIDFSRYGLPREPMVQESVKAGADVVCFSGDKLIGGPQSGIIVGKQTFIERIKKHPLTRALRCDKLTSAALESTLALFLKPEETIIREHRVISLLLKTPAAIKTQAEHCAGALHGLPQIECSVQASTSEIGGGSLSTEELPTFVLVVRMRGVTAQNLARTLRRNDPPVFGRVENDALVLDFRTVLDGQEELIVRAMRSACTAG